MYKKEKKQPFHSIITIIFYITLVSLLLYFIIPNTSLYYQKGVFQPFLHRLNENDIILITGEKFKLRVLNLNKRVSFSSLNFRIAGVTPFGTIMARKPGKTFITAKYDDKKLRCRVRVIGLDKDELKLKRSESTDLDVKGLKITSKVRWSTNDKSIAKVNRNGKVTGISKGTTIITAKVKNKVLKCSVTVY